MLTDKEVREGFSCMKSWSHAGHIEEDTVYDAFRALSKVLSPCGYCFLPQRDLIRISQGFIHWGGGGGGGGM